MHDYNLYDVSLTIIEDKYDSNDGLFIFLKRMWSDRVAVDMQLS